MKFHRNDNCLLSEQGWDFKKVISKKNILLPRLFRHPLCTQGCVGGTLCGPGAAYAESCTHPFKRDRCFSPPIAERQRMPNVGISILFLDIKLIIIWFLFDLNSVHVMNLTQVVKNVFLIHTNSVIGITDWPYWHIADEAKLLLFYRRHFELHFLEWILIWFDSNFTAVQLTIKAALVQIMVCCRTVGKELQCLLDISRSFFLRTTHGKHHIARP